jgi:pimeloyl-ACP methyl ester carboxylesterase
VRRIVVEVAGAPASYREAGAGVVAIVTAGLGLSSRFYQESYDAFAGAGIRLVVPDLPGWGETPGPRTGVSAAQTAAFLLAFADRIGVEKAVWIGHSVGVHPVTRIAAERPARARALVLVGPTGEPGRFILARQAAALAKEAARTSWRVRAVVARDYLTSSPLRYFGTWIRHARDDLVGRAPRVQCPTLLLAGDADPVCRPAFLELLRHRMPDARAEFIPGGTHALPRGQAAAFNRTVIRFIRELPAA